MNHVYRLEECARLAAKSPDPSTKVGAIVYNMGGVRHGEGFNSFAFRSICKADLVYYNNRELKYDRIIHAEMRALMMAGNEAFNGSLYTTLVPCKECAKHICDAGIKTVIFPAACMRSDWVQRNPAVVQITMQLFAESGVQVIAVGEG